MTRALCRAVILVGAAFAVGFAVRTALPTVAFADCGCFLDTTYKFARVESPTGGDTAAQEAALFSGTAREISVQVDPNKDRATYKAVVYEKDDERILFRIGLKEEP